MGEIVIGFEERPLPKLGGWHPRYGRVVAVEWDGWERSYHFIRGNTATRMPAGLVENEIRMPKKRAKRKGKE
jgi:hypothetical protein